jgi:aspartate aminotransferase
MDTTLQKPSEVSIMASNLVGSEIIKLAGDIKQRIARGEEIFNYTIGDFNPEIFPIPELLKEEIIKAYEERETNYPAANGIPQLRESLSEYIRTEQGLDYAPDSFLVAGGARPLIYATYQAIVDPGEKVLFPVPSWNNNHYTHLANGTNILVETSAENNFMPVAADFEEHISEAGLIALCSPLNPTGTVFSHEQLSSICEMVIAENEKRKGVRKPLYLLYDQIYWQLTFGDYKHHDPVSIDARMKPYTIFIDGISKCLAATGVRVGWAFGPDAVINKMKSILGHVGAWSPKAEQVATARYLKKHDKDYLKWIRTEVKSRLQGFHDGIQRLKESGLPIDSIHPQGAIYLTIEVNLRGLSNGSELIDSTEAMTSYLLNHAKLAVVPFYAFGTSRDSVWYRLSVGTAKNEDIPEVLSNLETALRRLS